MGAEEAAAAGGEPLQKRSEHAARSKPWAKGRTQEVVFGSFFFQKKTPEGFEQNTWFPFVGSYLSDCSKR